MIDLFHPVKPWELRKVTPSLVHVMFETNLGARRVYTAEEFADREKERQRQYQHPKLKFRLGEAVRWTSDGKSGVVVEVVEQGRLPEKFRARGVGRSFESYVVKVGAKNYWPLVSLLATGTEQQ